MLRAVSRAMPLAMIAILLISLLAACSGNNNASETNTKPANNTAVNETTNDTATTNDAEKNNAGSEPAKLDRVTLKFMLWGDKPNQFDDVVAEFEKQTKDTLNIKLDVSFTPLADYGNKLKLKLSGGSDVDLAFDAPWLTMPALIAQDNYIKLDGYFNNDKYPGLKKAFNETLLNNNKFQGADGQLSVFGVPLGQTYAGVGVLFYRKDLAKKYGMGDIQSYDDILAYYDKVKENEKNMIPFSFQKEQYPPYTIINGNTDDTKNRTENGIVTVDKATLVIKDKKVVASYIVGEDPKEALKDFPAPYNTELMSTGLLLSTEKETLAWNKKGYIEKNAINQKDAQAQFTAGKAASYMQDISNMPNIQNGLLASVPSAELGTFVFDNNTRNLVPGVTFSDYKFWNFLSIPASSKNADRTMMFLDWIFSDVEHHDLFELGIKGKHWEPIGDTMRYQIPEGVDQTKNYAFPGYMLTWNPNYVHFPATLPEGYDKFLNFTADANNYIKSPIAGFSFNQEPVKDAEADPMFGKVVDDNYSFTLGLNADVEAAHAKLQSKYSADKQFQKDIKLIKAEIIKQVEAYMAAN